MISPAIFFDEVEDALPDRLCAPEAALALGALGPSGSKRNLRVAAVLALEVNIELCRKVSEAALF
jgi:hypothetical protein